MQATDERPMTEERRLVTILFADVCGSTEMGERVDPEDLRALLSRFFSVARDVITAHGGRTEKFIGDAVMAVFGLPAAHDDDPVRAVAAAMELRDRTMGDPQLGEHLPIRLGVHTGEVVATRDAEAEDFLITGDAVNTAARLQQVAAPWDVLVSERCVRDTGERFTWGELLDVGARGKLLNVPARVVSGRRRTERRRMPLVDREVDLRQLVLVAERAFAERRPYLVTIVAPAGTGKTRLIQEFLEVSLPGLRSDAAVATAQCLPYGDQLNYWPLRGLLLKLLELGEGAAPETIRQATRTWLSDGGQADPDSVADLLMATLGENHGPVADRASLFSAWRAAIELAARRQPLVLVIEDLHWSSDTLLDLLEHVVAPHGNVPILAIVLARPQLLDRRPAWGGGRRNYLSLTLEALADESVQQLVDHHLGEHIPAVVQQVVERAAGNPLFVGELVRAIREQASLDDAVSVAEVVSRLPDTIQGTLLARLDLLDASARRVLQLGSVFGRRFTVEGVEGLDQSLKGDVTTFIPQLADHDLVVSDPAGGLVFQHMLIRDVAYQTLTRADRATLHAAAARWIEGTAAGLEDQIAELIAYHWHEALALARASGRPVDEVTRSSATEWLRRAALVDLRGAAGPEAARHLTLALDTADDDELPELNELLGDALIIGEDAAGAYARALRIAEERGLTADDRLRLLGKLLTVHTRWQGAIRRRLSADEMRVLLERGEMLLEQAHDERAIATFLIACGFLPYWRAGAAQAHPPGDIERCREATERGLRIAREIGDPSLQSAALDALSGVAQSLGRHREACDFASQRLDFADRLSLAERLDANAFCAWESCLLGDYEAAVTMTDTGAQLIELHEGHVAGLHLAAWRAHAMAMLGDWDRALAVAAKADAVWTETGRREAAYAVHGFLAALEICRAREDEPGIERWQAVIEEVCQPFDEQSFARLALHAARLDRDAMLRGVSHPVALVERSHFVERALGACLDRDWLVDEQALKRLLADAVAQELRPLEIQVRRGLGLVDRSREELTRAGRLAAEISARPLVGRLDWELARLSGDRDLRAKAVAELRVLGDTLYLRREEPAVSDGRTD